MAIDAAGQTANGRPEIPFRGLDPNVVREQGVPAPDEIEITLLGVNESSGESIVIHIGNDEWIVIDCCTTREGINLPLFYLTALGVNLDNVKRVACTHLHSDHVNGLSEVLRNCKNAWFAYPLIGDETSMEYILAEYNLDESLPNKGVFGEFMKCIEIMKKEKREYAHLNIDTPIYADKSRHVMGISPSRKLNEIYQYKLLKYKPGDPIPTHMLKTNFCSVATILNIGNVNAILGADLEANRAVCSDIHLCKGTCKRKSKRGWCNVFEGSQYFKCYQYDYIKIPHHSSQTGFCSLLWDNFIIKPSVGTSTVFHEGDNILPTEEMKKEYATLCSELYYTSRTPQLRKDKIRGAMIDEKKGAAFDDLVVIPEQIGVITSRKQINGGEWHTNYLFSAIREK